MFLGNVVRRQSMCIVAFSFLLGVPVTEASQETARYIEAWASEEDVPTMLVMHPNTIVFLCNDRSALEDILVNQLYDNVEDNMPCGLVEAGQLTFLSAVVEKHTVLVEGESMRVGFYPVKAFTESYVLAWPNALDPHIVEADYGGSEALIQRGFPPATEPQKPIVGIREVMIAGFDE